MLQTRGWAVIKQMDESESLSPEEKNILKNLEELEKYSLMNEYTDEALDDIVKIMIETIDWVAESIESTDVELPMQIMDMLEYLDSVIPTRDFRRSTSRRGYKILV